MDKRLGASSACPATAHHHGGLAFLLAVYVFGTMVAMPSLTLMGLDLFPHRQGLASSCQGFVQTLSNAAVTGLIAPMLWGSPRTLSGGMLTMFSIGGAAFVAYIVSQRSNACMV